MKRWGILFQPGALWLGAHYSPHDRRWCINLAPCLTLWITRKGGRPPKCVREEPAAEAIVHANCSSQLHGAWWGPCDCGAEKGQEPSPVAKYRQRQRNMLDSEGARQWRAECDAVAREFGH